MSKAIPIAGDIITSKFYGETSPWVVDSCDEDGMRIHQKNNPQRQDGLRMSNYQDAWWILELAPKDTLKQVGGNHYEKMGISPIDVITANGLDFFEGSALKYLLHYRDKNGVEDLKKAIWYIEYLINRESNV
jgi:hypothetical protein